MTWRLMHIPKDGSSTVELLEGEWSDEEIEQAAQKIIDSGKDSIILRDVVREFLPDPIKEAL